MVTAYDVDPSELIAKVAEALKKDGNIKPPAWAPFVKTGTNRQRPPVN
ncbi:40S ribosomal protein S19, partial [Candidatus Woesearchaeota archaeon]|nr:40S ribosomal protein S19 [Candidatus Woesearchaeota archaeon]